MRENSLTKETVTLTVELERERLKKVVDTSQKKKEKPVKEMICNGLYLYS